MRTTLLRRTLAGGAVALTTAVAPAAAQTSTQSNGTPFTASSLTGFATIGSLMAGMRVTGYAGANAVTGTWADLGGGLYGVSNGLFSLTLGSSANTNVDPWTLTNRSSALSLTRLVLSGAPGLTVFDRSFGNLEGTPGSSFGRDFEFVGAGPVGTVALFTNVVGIGGAAPVGDLFETLDVTFGAGLAAGVSLQYIVDTDSVSPSGSINPVVPEPSTYALVAAGLAGMGAVARRRRRAPTA